MIFAIFSSSYKYFSIAFNLNIYLYIPFSSIDDSGISLNKFELDEICISGVIGRTHCPFIYS